MAASNSKSTASLSEFQIPNFGLEYHYPDVFVKSQWGWPRAAYLVYRLTFAVYLSVWVVLSGVLSGSWYNDESRKITWFVYLTNWTFTTLTLNSIIQCINVIYATWKKANREKDVPVFESMTWSLKLQWVVYNISTNISLIVSLAYWTFLFNPKYGVDAVDFSTHTMNSVLVLIDLFMNAMPIRVLHLPHGVAFITTYLCFNAAYVAAGGINGNGKPYIYHALSDANLWKTAFLSVATVIGSIAMWVVVFGLYKLRMVLYRKLKKPELTHVGTDTLPLYGSVAD